MKKFFSLMLVALLLVSALPFAASAAGFSVAVTVDDVFVYAGEYETITYAECLAQSGIDTTTKNITNFVCDGADLVEGGSATLTGPAFVYFWTEDKATEPTTEPTTESTTEAPADTFDLYFHDELGGKVSTVAVENAATVTTVPSGSLVEGHDFVGWYTGRNGTGDKLIPGTTKWYEGMSRDYYAYYIESVNDGVSVLSVYVRFYVGGEQQGNTKLLYTRQFDDGDNMFSWLANNETKTSNAIFALEGSEGYQWNPRYYYDYTGTEPLSEQDLIADGNKSVVVKVYSKKATEANVLLYIHKNTTGYPLTAIYEMPGYTQGNTITLASAKNIIKEHYTGSNMTVQGLYSDSSWAQLLNGENPTAANGIKVEHNGTTKVHVILKNATATNASKVDSTNPQTGDYITAAVTTMVVAAAALVSMVELKKRKMI